MTGSLMKSERQFNNEDCFVNSGNRSVYRHLNYFEITFQKCALSIEGNRYKEN